mgnify:CR=1 FL=1
MQKNVEVSVTEIVCPHCNKALKIRKANCITQCPSCNGLFVTKIRNKTVEERRGKRISFWKRLLFSPTLAEKNAAHRIAYIGVVTAFIVASNMFEFKLFDTQFSFTLLISMLSGVIIGPLFGFAACFLGDLVGFLVNSSGFAYMPWIGISMGLAAMLAGFIVGGIPAKYKWVLYAKLGLICVLTFSLCTVAINTTAFWLLYAKVGYGQYLFARLFVQGQIWNSLVNYALLFLITPALAAVKPLGIKIR